MILLHLHGVLTFANNWKGKPSLWKDYQRFDFKVGEKACYVVVPRKPASEKFWVWRARFPGYHSEADVLLLDRGFHIAYINTNGMLGSPHAMKHWDEFYETMTQQHGLASKVALEAVSRGGLFVYRWAARHPDRVACIYADVPVCDFKSWPLGQGRGIGDQKTWQNLLKQYGFTEVQALAYRKNPIDVLAPIAKAKIPLLHIVTMNDRIVPPSENTLILAERYRSFGGAIEVLEIEKGPRVKGHHFDHPNPIRVADFIQKHAQQKNLPSFE